MGLIACDTARDNASDSPFEAPGTTTDVITPESASDHGTPQTVDTDASIHSACDSNSPISTNDMPCGQWQCEFAAYPACWTCQNTPLPPGTPCMDGEGLQGQCSGLNCISDSQVDSPMPTDVRDLSNPGIRAVEITSVDLTLGSWVLNEIQTLTIYAPTGATNTPVIILHHGFNLSAQDYSSYGTYLASWGFTVVMPNTNTGFLGGPTQRDMADILHTIIQWLDQSDTDANHQLSDRISVDGYVIAGHSLGGKLSFLIASESDRVLGVFGIDPVDTSGGPGSMPSPSAPSVAPELMPQIEVPFVVVGETTNATSSFGPACAPSEDNFAQYFDASNGPALKIEIIGASHMSFLDNPNCGLSCLACPVGTDDPESTRRLTQKYLTAFSTMVLKGQSGARLFLVGEGIDADVDANLVRYNISGDF